MADQHLLGKEAEEAAVEYIVKKGYKLRDRNWYSGHAELDIVAETGNWIVFLEVKCRSGNYYEEPFEAVNRKKQKLIIRAANAYIRKFDIDLEARFDIISIVKRKDAFEIEHIEDAFYPLL